MAEFFKQEAGEADRVVADDAAFFHQMVEDAADAEFLQFGDIGADRFGAFGAVAREQFR